MDLLQAMDKTKEYILS